MKFISIVHRWEWRTSKYNERRNGTITTRCSRKGTMLFVYRYMLLCPDVCSCWHSSHSNTSSKSQSGSNNKSSSVAITVQEIQQRCGNNVGSGMYVVARWDRTCWWVDQWSILVDIEFRIRRIVSIQFDCILMCLQTQFGKRSKEIYAVVS